MALAIFLGSEKFDTVIGALDESSLRACQSAGRQVVLANRQDLRLHFVFSAALKILASSGLSFSIGEFKELLDSQHGSSGFGLPIWRLTERASALLNWRSMTQAPDTFKTWPQNF